MGEVPNKFVWMNVSFFCIIYNFIHFGIFDFRLFNLLILFSAIIICVTDFLCSSHEWYNLPLYFVTRFASFGQSAIIHCLRLFIFHLLKLITLLLIYILTTIVSNRLYYYIRVSIEIKTLTKRKSCLRGKKVHSLTNCEAIIRGQIFCLCSTRKQYLKMTFIIYKGFYKKINISI